MAITFSKCYNDTKAISLDIPMVTFTECLYPLVCLHASGIQRLIQTLLLEPFLEGSARSWLPPSCFWWRIWKSDLHVTVLLSDADGKDAVELVHLGSATHCHSFLLSRQCLAPASELGHSIGAAWLEDGRGWPGTWGTFSLPRKK